MNSTKHTYVKIFILSFFIIFFTIFINYSNPDTTSDIQSSLSTKLIRFHVIANSDTDNDQSLKILVKDAVLSYLEPLLSDVNSIEEARNILNNELPNIINISTDILKKNNCVANVTAQLCKDYFPIKMYGNVTLPAGEYEALEINIGDAVGKNWWCIMYPTLCFVDCTYTVIPEKSEEKLHSILTDEEFDIIMNQNTTIKYDFKILNILKDFILLFMID